MATYVYISHEANPAESRRLNEDRWRNDGVSTLAQGFTLRQRGRAGSIYYREGDQVLEVPYEISGTSLQDILVTADGASFWIAPFRKEVGRDEQLRVLAGLSDWLKRQGIRALIE